LEAIVGIVPRCGCRMVARHVCAKNQPVFKDATADAL
jgi:hypothetical protein